MSEELHHILHVEDDPDISRLVKLTLETLGGYQITQCVDAPDTLNIADDIDPQMVLIDVMLPGMDGMALCTLLREKAAYQDCPVVFMTAKVQKHEVERYQQLGAAGVISKPFSPDDLISQIKGIWQQYRGQ